MTLTSDLGGEVGGVTGYEQLKLLVQVTAFQVDVPGPNSCRRENDGELTLLVLVQHRINSPRISQIISFLNASNL